MQKIDVTSTLKRVKKYCEGRQGDPLDYCLNMIRHLIIDKNNLIETVDTLKEKNERLKLYKTSTRGMKESLNKLTAEKSKWLRKQQKELNK